MTVPALHDVLAVSTAGDDVFESRSASHLQATRMYGGEVAAQALMAAQATVPADRPVHSFHGYFVLGGDPAQPLQHHVGRTRDGGSFTTRRVRSEQSSGEVFIAMASFQRHEDASIAHQLPHLRLHAPDESMTVDEVAAASDELTGRWLGFLRGAFPWELRFPAMPPRPGSVDEGPRRTWFRAVGALPDAPGAHAAALMHASDMFLLGSALQLHGVPLREPGLFVTSLDHTVWFHRPVRVDDWLLYDARSSWADNGRALCRGRFFDTDGRLVATVAQEGLVRRS